MSEYIEAQTSITNRAILVDALCAMGFPRDGIEVHDSPKPLVGYLGDSRQQLAHVIVRRRCVGSSSNDIGFVRGEDGKFSAIISKYDREDNKATKYNAKWLGKLQGHYAVLSEKKYWQAQGYVVQQRTDAKGLVHLTVEK